MNLFDLPESQPDRLTAARARFARAQDAIDAADTDETGELNREWAKASAELEAAELEAMRK